MRQRPAYWLSSLLIWIVLGAFNLSAVKVTIASTTLMSFKAKSGAPSHSNSTSAGDTNNADDNDDNDDGDGQDDFSHAKKAGAIDLIALANVNFLQSVSRFFFSSESTYSNPFLHIELKPPRIES